MKLATLSIVRIENRILLGKKREGFGKDLWNGYGGHRKKGEDLLTAAMRELVEETGMLVPAKNFHKMALIRSTFIERPEFNKLVHVFLVEGTGFSALETLEMYEPTWFQIDALPFSQMWAGDAYWIPTMLQKKRLIATLSFSGHTTPFSLVSQKIRLAA